MTENHTCKKIANLCLDRDALKIKSQIFPFDFKLFLSFLRMLFAITLIGVISIKEQPNNVLEVAHNDLAVDGRPLLFLSVQF